MVSTDSFYKKTIPFRIFDKNLKFRVSQDLFSSFALDHGSSFLLRSFEKKLVAQAERILDVGCGYGVLGLSLAKKNPKAHVHLIDRDALALAFTKQNTKENSIENVQVYGSLGYDNVKEKFDLIVSNIPAKVGEPVLRHLLLDAQRYVTENGLAAIVVVKELEEFVENSLTQENITILKKEQRKGHTVFQYRFKLLNNHTGNAFENGVYDRDFVEMPFVNSTLKTVYGLPEFDTPSFATDLLAGMILDYGKNASRALFINPGQGFLPVIATNTISFKHLSLFSRDLLQLKNSKRNLVENKFQKEYITMYHQTEVPAAEADLIIGVLRDEEGPEVHQVYIKKLSNILSSPGTIFLAASSTTITRIESFICQEKLFIIKKRKKNKGFSVVYLQKNK